MREITEVVERSIGGCNIAFFQGGDGIESARDDQADMADADGYIQQRLIGFTNHENAAQAKFLQFIDDGQGIRQCNNWDFTKAGADTAGTGLGGLQDRGHFTFDKYLQRING